MTVFDRYLSRRYAGALGMAVLTLAGLFIAIDYATRIGVRAAEQNVPALDVAAYYGALLPRLLIDYQLAGVGALLASLLVFGSLAQCNETIAIHAGGVPLRRLLIVPVCVSLAVCVLLFAINEAYGARAARLVAEWEVDRFDWSADEVAPGVSWAHLNGAWTAHIGTYDRSGHQGEAALLLRGTPPQEIIRARRIRWDPADRAWLLEGVSWITVIDGETGAAEMGRAAHLRAPIRETPAELFAIFEDPALRDTESLREVIAQAERRLMPVHGAVAAYHKKFAGPALPLVMCLLGIPFAVRVRRGGIAVAFGLTIAIALCFFVLSNLAGWLGVNGRLDPVVSAWGVEAVFMGGALALLARTPT